MGSSELDLTGTVSIALGGMIGGGIYAVLGVVAGLTGGATWAAFLVAGIVALCAAYSYNALNRLADNRGGTVTFVQSFTGNTTLAGMAGWTLLVGYVGSMAMYAFAFGEFAVAFEAVPADRSGLPARPAISVLAVGGFVGLNLLGARTTGLVETAMVGIKVAILLAFGLFGLVYTFGPGDVGGLRLGLDRLAGTGPLVAAAVSFVAFQGWELLFYDQESIENPTETIRRGVYVAIPAAILVYVLVGVVTVTVAPSALESQPHVALKIAASEIATPYGLASAGGIVIALSALFSTGSAINATLFSAAHFAKGMLRDDLLPDAIGDSQAEGNPGRTVIVLGGLTAAFAAVGSLGAIASFASLSFIVIFGSVSLLAFTVRTEQSVNPLPPAIGAVGCALFLPLMLWNLLQREPATLGMVVAIAVAVVTVELLYFERDVLEREIEQFESAVAGAVGEDD